MADQTVVTPEVQAMVGTETEPASAPQEVCRSEIRRFVQAIMSDDPLWYDEEYAKKTQFGPGCAPAPYTLRAVGYFRRPLGTPDPVRSRSVDEDVRGDLDVENTVRVPWPAGVGEFHGGSEVEYLQLPRVGDIITSVSKIVKIEEKTGRSGRLGLLHRDRIFTNQNGEVLAIHHHINVARQMKGKG